MGIMVYSLLWVMQDLYHQPKYSSTWRVFRGLSKWVVSRLISTLKGTLIGVMILISPENKQLLSPPTLQAEKITITCM